MGHGLLHHARRFHHLGQEHLARAEQIADHVHAVHQRAFDDLNRPSATRGDFRARFFGVFDDKRGDAMHHRVSQAFFDRLRVVRRTAPIEVVFAPRSTPLETLGNFEQPLGVGQLARGRAIQHHVFHAIAQLRIQSLVDAELARVDDAHIHASANRVIQENRMYRLAYCVVATKRERHVRHAAADFRVRQVLFDPARRVDEIDRVVVVLFDTGGDRENVRIENNVFRREADFVDQDVVAALANFGLALVSIGLAFLVEGHHDGGRAVAAYQPRVLLECLDAFLHRDRVDDRLALHAFQARFDHFPFRGVDHDGHACDIGFGRDQIQKAHHRRFRIEHGLVHVDIDHLRAVLDLLARDHQRLVELGVQDHAGERFRAGYVGAFADIDEQCASACIERLEASQAHESFGWRLGGRGVDLVVRGVGLAHAASR